MKLKLVFLSIIALSFTFLVGCEDDEVSAIAEAQKCLDSIPTDVDTAEANAGLTNGEIWQKAAACADKVSGYSSQQAQIIKCGAYLTGGGLDTQRIVDAAKELNDDESNSESVYLAALTLNKPDDTTNTTIANLAQAACNATGIDSYIYIGNLAATGTALSAALGGSGFPDDLSSISDGDIDTAIDNCVNDSSCVTTIASSAEDIASSYCDSESNEDDEICQDISQAISDANGDESVLAETLLCLLDGQAANCVP